MDIEQLMERLGGAGVTVLIKMDDECMAVGAAPWTVLLSGSALADQGFIRAEGVSLRECLASAMARLRTRPGDWEWLAQDVVGQVKQVMARLAAGKTSREDASGWAMERLDSDEYTSIPVVWTALQRLAGADLQTSPGVYLHGEADFHAWLSDFSSSGGREVGNPIE